MNNNKKIALYYSIFCNSDNLQSSIIYVCSLCANIKTYQLNNIISKNIYLVICTDYYTQQIIKKMCYNEKIKLDNIIFKLFTKNPNNYLRGAFWRFNALIDTDFDITLTCEADFSLNYNLRFLHIFEQYAEYNISGIVNRIPTTVVDRYILASSIITRPINIVNTIRQKIKNLLDLFNCIDCLPYGADERFIKRLAEILLINEKWLFNIQNSGITDGLKTDNDINITTNFLQTKYKNCKLIINAPQTNKYLNIIKDFSYTDLTFIIKTANSNQLYYHYDNQVYALTNGNHGYNNIFCNTIFWNVIDNIFK